MRTIICLACAFFFTLNGNAQELPKLKTAVFGNFYAGIATLQDQRLDKHLQQENLFGAGFGQKQAGLTYGGELATIYRAFVTSFGAYGIRHNRSSNLAGTAQSSVYGAYLKFGRSIYQNEKQLLYPFVAFGMSSYYARIGNLADSAAIYFNRDEAITAGNEIRYSFSSILYEAGLSYKYLIGSGNGLERNGFILGIEAGVQFYDALEGFHSSNRKDQLWLIGSMPGAYLRITCGGGKLN